MPSTEGITPIFSIHSLERYAERFPGRDGIESEWQTARTASNSELRLIRRMSVCHARAGKVATKGQMKHWISRTGCVMVTAPDCCKLVVVTCFPMPKSHPKDGGKHYMRGQITDRVAGFKKRELDWRKK